MATRRFRFCRTLSSMNNVVGVFEHEGDMEGNVSTKIWDWK